jgi:signal transduction histidine kinase
MARFVRFSAFQLAIAYALLSIGVLGVLAIPLWYAWDRNIQDVREALIREDAQTMSDILDKQGIDALVGVIDARVQKQHTGNAVISLSNTSSARIAGNFAAPPRNIPEASGVFASTVDVDGRPIHALLMRTRLPGGYDLVVGRSTARFQRLETFFEYGLAGAASVIVLAAVLGGLSIRRALLGELHGINRTTAAIVEGDLSRRLPVSGGTSELDMLAQTVNRMLDQTEQLVHGVRNVSNAIAHDLRTPLAELRVRLEMLLATQHSGEETRLEIEAAVADVDRVIGIFNALLRLAQIETGARRSGFAQVDLAHVAREVVEFYQPVAELEGVSLTCACDSSIFIAGDFLLLSQAIGNLIDNAVKYAQPNGAIEVDAASCGETACVTVADDGPGIPPGEISKVSERFYRGDRSRGTPGVGLGLSLVAAVATLHRGRLKLEDNGPGLRATLVVSRDPPPMFDASRGHNL